MRRRHLFPAILIGASGLWSMVAAFASTPVQTHDFLNALTIDENYALGAQWQDANIPHEDKLSDADQTLFIQLLEQFDGQVSKTDQRQLFIDQAGSEFQRQKCQPEQCQLSVYLNRNLAPQYIHGDLRLVQLQESSIQQSVSVSADEITYGEKTKVKRQVRFMLTERGWVLKSVEIVESLAFSNSQVIALETGKISGINYYPRSAPWDKFWGEFPVDDIERDLDAISDLGANAVRIFMQHEYFANLDTQKDGLTKLQRFLDMSAKRDIKVIITMFDLRADYRLQNWSRDSVHLSTILDVIHDHDALLAVDLKNQPDLDFKPSGERQVTVWLEAMISSARQNHPNIPLTIGWSDPAQADKLSDQLNLVSVHDYNDPRGLSERLNTLRIKVADRPVFVTEIGHSRWSPTGDKTQRQAKRLDAQLSQLKNVDGVFVWTLNDFDEIGSNIVGHRPWRKAQQKAYGITNKDGAWRPAAQAFHAFNQSFLSTVKGD